jgi:polyphosphate glucokinase
MDFLGIDIGCTSIKYGLVNFEQGIKVRGFDSIFISEGSRTQKYCCALIQLLQSGLVYHAAGFGFPSVVKNDQILNTAIQFNEIWGEVSHILHAQNIPCFALNDADVAGIAEVYRHEAAPLRQGVTIVITLGTGIGSAIFLDGKLLPNTELGLVQFHGMPAENYTAASVKTSASLSLEDWAARLQEYLAHIEMILSPDHIVLAGGISTDFEAYKPLLSTSASLLPAFYRNQAGVMGAAMYAADQTHHYKLT